MLTALLYFATAIAATRLARVRWQIALALVVLPLAFTGRALLTGRVYAPIDLPYSAEPLYVLKAQYGVGRPHNGLLSDVYSHNIPWKAAVRDAYRHGELPLWNPHIFGGDVLAGAAQPAAYDPLLLLSLILPLPNSLTFLASIALFLAGLGMYLLLRDLGVGEIARLTGAAAWMFSTFIVMWLEWALGATTIWLPLLVLGVRRVIRTRSPRSAALLTFSFVMMLLAGHPESALHLVAIGAAWAVAELWAVRGKGLVRAGLLAVGSGVVALLLCAIYLLPVMEALPQTHEHELRRGFFTTLPKSAPLPLALAKLEAQLVPFIHGMPQSEWPDVMPFEPPLESAWCGSAALALAAFGAWRSPSRAKWAALALIAGGLLLGIRLWPFADVLGKLPLFDISLNDRLVVAAAFGVALLAALGANELEGGRPARPLIVTSIIVAVVLMFAFANAAHRLFAQRFSSDFIHTQAAILIAGPLLVALIAAKARGRTACVLLLLLVVAQRTIEVGDLYPTLPARMFYPPIPVLAKLPKGGEPFRIVGQQAELIPNSATLYGLEDVRGYQALRLRRWVETIPLWSVPQGVWWNRVDDLTPPFLSMLNVRYALAPWNVPVAPGWTKIAEQPGTFLLENTRALGRAYVPRRVRRGVPKDAMLKEMKQARDFAERSWIDARLSAPREELNGPGVARVTKNGRGELAIRASMQGGGWMVISETAWKGWHAFVDGQPAPIRFANHTVLGVYVPQGEHTVRLVYRPQAFVIGAWMSGLTLLALVIGSAAAEMCRKMRGPGSGTRAFSSRRNSPDP